MLRLVMVWGLLSASTACMTEADQKLWSEFQESRQKKSDDQPAAPPAEASSKDETKSEAEEKTPLK